MSEYYLMHSGRSKVDGAPVGSGRYPLGSGERPYQKGSPGGDRHLSRRERRRMKKEKPLQKLTDEEKQKIINEGDVKEAYRHRRELTNNDIDAVMTRHNKEKDLFALIPKKKTGMDYVNKATEITNTGIKAVLAGVNVWNIVSSIHNVRDPGNPWPTVPSIPIIGGGNSSKKKK